MTGNARWRFPRIAMDRMPVRVLALAAGALLVGVTAAFGGLATVDDPAPQPLATGGAFEQPPFAITLQRALLFDALTDAGLDAEPGTRVLAVSAQVEDTWTRPIDAGPDGSLPEALAVDGLGRPDGVLRVDDATISPDLQPGVPAQLVLVWRVPGDAYADGDAVAVTLSELQLVTGSFVTTGQWWTGAAPRATESLAVVDRGTGS